MDIVVIDVSCVYLLIDDLARKQQCGSSACSSLCPDKESASPSTSSANNIEGQVMLKGKNGNIVAKGTVFPSATPFMVIHVRRSARLYVWVR